MMGSKCARSRALCFGFHTGNRGAVLGADVALLVLVVLAVLLLAAAFPVLFCFCSCGRPLAFRQGASVDGGCRELQTMEQDGRGKNPSFVIVTSKLFVTNFGRLVLGSNFNVLVMHLIFEVVKIWKVMIC